MNLRVDSCFWIDDWDLGNPEDFLNIWRRRKVFIDRDGCFKTDESEERRHYS